MCIQKSGEIVENPITEDDLMLVLSRKEGEKIVIDDNIVITVNRIVGQRVSIGIEAPPDIKISRGELLRQLSQRLLHVAVGA